MVQFLVMVVVDTLPLLDGYAGYGIEVADHLGAGLGARVPSASRISGFVQISGQF